MSASEGPLGRVAGVEPWERVVRVVLRLGIGAGLLAAAVHPGVRGGFVDALWETPLADVVVTIGVGVLLLMLSLAARFVSAANRKKFQRTIDEHAGLERGDGEVL